MQFRCTSEHKHKFKMEETRPHRAVRIQHIRIRITLITSAPKSDIIRATEGAATTLAISTTLTPANTGAPLPGAVGAVVGQGTFNWGYI